MDDFNTMVFFCIIVCDYAGIISRAVVYENDFEILIGLVDDGVKASGKIFCGVVNGNND